MDLMPQENKFMRAISRNLKDMASTINDNVKITNKPPSAATEQDITAWADNLVNIQFNLKRPLSLNDYLNWQPPINRKLTFKKSGKIYITKETDYEPQDLALMMFPTLQTFIGLIATLGAAEGIRLLQASLQDTLDEAEEGDLTPEQLDAIAVILAQEAETAWIPYEVVIFNWINEHAFETITDLNETTHDLLVSAMSEWYLSGEPLSELADIIDQQIDNPYRARLIAMTETTQASAEGSMQVWREIGDQINLIIEKQWNNVNDSDVCPYCNGLHGQVVALDSDFDVTVEIERQTMPPRIDTIQVNSPPAHAGCRCSLIPITRLPETD